MVFDFRNIFLGETFSSYISVHNDSGSVCKDILIKVSGYSHRDALIPQSLTHTIWIYI